MLLHPLAVPVFGMECSHSHGVPPLGHCQKKWPPWQRHLLTRQNHHQDPCARPWGMTQRTPEPQPHVMMTCHDPHPTGDQESAPLMGMPGCPHHGRAHHHCLPPCASLLHVTWACLPLILKGHGVGAAVVSTQMVSLGRHPWAAVLRMQTVHSCCSLLESCPPFTDATSQEADFGDGTGVGIGLWH